MRILVLANDGDGLYIFRGMLLKKLIDEGHEVYISIPASNYTKQLRELKCKILTTKVDRRGINPVKDLRLIMDYMKYIKRIKPDKVITYTIKPNLYGGIACRLSKTEMYANVTGLGSVFQNDNWLKTVVVSLYKIALKRARVVFFENTGNRDIVVANKIVPVEKTHCLHGAGVDLDKFRYCEYPKEGVTRFLFIGRVMKEKGIDELLYSAKKLSNDKEKIEIDILGGFEDDYKSIITQYYDEGIINYHGYQTDVKPYIQNAHCFVLPSYHEGMANTLLECGAMGRPLITSNIHGCLEAVQDGKTGYLCKVKDADALYEKMKQFIELPYEQKKEMGRLSHEYVASVFDKRKVVEETLTEIFR